MSFSFQKFNMVVFDKKLKTDRHVKRYVYENGIHRCRSTHLDSWIDLNLSKANKKIRLKSCKIVIIEVRSSYHKLKVRIYSSATKNCFHLSPAFLHDSLKFEFFGISFDKSALIKKIKN
ncbi:hypothetical protein BpHYR1_046564 [Brachionus plicatilis]|uniref:Uncharacterized protein n=1 Tax=Brachionus plicatilis TaxID=10195 RepID=A0A3M7QL73_BRAPC|nr:hypothetical protein BpHYR1_046564 [Brachionus plicatilis]